MTMKLYLETMGCPKNFNDSESIAGICEAAGMEITDSIEDADIILVNTCGFINDAKQESIGCIFDMIRFIDEAEIDDNGDKRKLLIVSGCLSQRYGDELADELPEVDIFLGVNDYEKLPEMIRSFKHRDQIRIFSCQPEIFEEFSARKIPDNPYSMTLRIAEGCNNCCTYCIIPQIRGTYRSRSMEKILEEAEYLASKGCRELILIAQDVTEYGRDLYGRLALPELLRKLCSIEGIEWIRLMYCYEDKITDDLIDVMASEKKICNYIDIPLQHISDGVLCAMNRHSTGAGIRNTIKRLRTAIPDIHIRTTMIVGFPGESEDQFEELLNFIEETRFERLGVFAYSCEEGTVAGDMSDQVDEEIKMMRVDEIMRRQLEISREINMSKVGDTMDVIIDDVEDDGSYTGRTMYDAPEIDNSVIFSGSTGLCPGNIVKVRITDAFDYDLTGRMEE